MKVDISEYREKYLKEVEEHIMAKKENIPHYTSQNLHSALLTEMNRADEETWEIEVPDDKQQAITEAADRVIETMKKNVDLGVGKSF